MRILLACDIATDGGGNPYTLQLLHALETHPQIASVQHGTSWMHVPEALFDVVHIHWPEALVNFNRSLTSQDIGCVQEVLSRWTQESKIVTTVHNEHPHNSDSEMHRRLYQMVYENSDGIIHLGKISKKVIRRRYANELKGTCEQVIPHGNYSWFPNTISSKAARRRLGVGANASVVLSFGSIRSSEETNVLLKGFEGIKSSPKQLLIVGRRTPASKRTFDFYRQELRLRCDPRIQMIDRFVPPDQVQFYLNAADILAIPRLKALNSGNLALGYTFGCVVVGPDYGVIGEILRDTGNPVFDPAIAASLSKAFQKASKLSEKGLGRKNRDYSQKHWDWKNTSNEHVTFYKEIIGKKFL